MTHYRRNRRVLTPPWWTALPGLVGFVLLAALLGIAVADGLTGYDTLASAVRCIGEQR